MGAFASSLIDWSALWRIVLAALIGGSGVVIAFGFMVLGLERARAAKAGGVRFAHWALAGACGMFCIGAVAVGIYAMAEKHPTKPAPKSKPAALSTPPKPAALSAPSAALSLPAAPAGT
jgi:hypothetical protein